MNFTKQKGLCQLVVQENVILLILFEVKNTGSVDLMEQKCKFISQLMPTNQK